MSPKKKYLKTKDRCKITFRLPKAAVPGARTVHIVGEFTGIVDLPPGQESQFRYLIDQALWENDWEADRYVESDFGECENSVVVVQVQR